MDTRVGQLFMLVIVLTLNTIHRQVLLTSIYALVEGSSVVTRAASRVV